MRIPRIARPRRLFKLKELDKLMLPWALVFLAIATLTVLTLANFGPFAVGSSRPQAKSLISPR